VRERFLVIGKTLSVKLSYLNGSLTGMETYFQVPEAEYWEKNYDEMPRVLTTLSHSVGFTHPHGVFALHQNGPANVADSVHATELIGKGGMHVPDDVWNYIRVKRDSVDFEQYLHVPDE
jgi:hypothetical protein